MSQEEWNKNAEDDVQMPLGVGGGETPVEEYSESGSSSGGTKVNTSTLALIAAFAAGLIVLYLLGLQNKPRVASADESERNKETEQRLKVFLADSGNQAQLNDLFHGNTSKLAEILTKYFDRPPTSTEMLHNPFDTDSQPSSGPTVSVVPDDAKEAAELRAAADEFSKIKLQMVMVGNPSTAVINNKIMQPGQKLEHLIILDIKPDGVILMFKDKKFKLTPSTDKDTK